MSNQRHDCCYNKCERPATVYIGVNGNPDTQWCCQYHSDKWHADKERFGQKCQMECCRQDYGKYVQ